ncbi:MAG: hypothetical protein AB7G12_10280 [Thermoanaerobaculia bacterium]
MTSKLRSTALVGALALAALLVATAAPLVAQAPITGLYYQEVEKEGRVYVFNTPEQLKLWSESGDVGKAITLIGRAEGGRTLIGENETAIDLYLFKHNLPAYDRPTPKPKAEPKYPSTKIQGRFYGDFTSKENKRDDGVKSSDSGIGVDVKRFYLTVTHQIDETWSAQFQSDIGDVGARRYDVFVKKAYIQGKFSDALTFRLGAADTPWIPYVEGKYGMRYFEQTITDSLGFGTSSDWGLHLLGKAGMFNYQVSAVNGKSYSRPERSESVDIEARLAIEPVKGLDIAVGGYSGKLGNDVKTNSPVQHTAERLNAFVGYSTDVWGVGVEYFDASNWKNVTTVAEDSANGYTVFANFRPAKSWNIFARYDNANPSDDLAPNKEITYYTAGIEKQFNKVFTANFAYKHAETEGGAVSTGNGSVGGGTNINGDYDEVGFWFVYNF